MILHFLVLRVICENLHALMRFCPSADRSLHRRAPARFFSANDPLSLRLCIASFVCRLRNQIRSCQLGAKCIKPLSRPGTALELGGGSAARKSILQTGACKVTRSIKVQCYSFGLRHSLLKLYCCRCEAGFGTSWRQATCIL